MRTQKSCIYLIISWIWIHNKQQIMCLKVVEHSAEQSAAIKLPQQGIVYQN